VGGFTFDPTASFGWRFTLLSVLDNEGDLDLFGSGDTSANYFLNRNNGDGTLTIVDSQTIGFTPQ
jgi:hypothetical protein